MKNNQYENIEVVIPQENYHSFLKVINGISFTQREIDIIACMLSGRSTKKIASFLALSPKTVENHIRNIKLKIGCKSQENIIDFMERSGKSILIKKYYSSLVIQATFEIELKKISTMTLLCKENLSCLIIYNKEQNNNVILINQLKNHLNLAGIKTSIEIKVEENAIIPSIGKTQSQHTGYTIYSLPTQFIEQPGINHHFAFSGLMSSNNKKPKSIIFLLLDNNPSTAIFEPQDGSEYIVLAKKGNYYLLVFKILKTLLPTISLDKNILEFKKQCETLYDPISHKLEAKESKILEKELLSTIVSNKFKTSRWWISLGVILCLTFFYIAFFILNNIKEWVLIKNKKETINLLKVEDKDRDFNNTLKLEAKEICKVPEPCEFFSGRIDFMDKIKNILRNNKKIVIVGYQGMGKTQVSYKYAKQNVASYVGGIYLFKADTNQSLMNSIRSFSIAIGVVTENEIYHLNDDQFKKLIIPLLQNHLEKQKRMLFIFDNVNNYDAVRDLISIQSKRHHIIITSCSKKWDAWNSLELKEFDKEKEEAEQLILRILKNETQQNAQKLANKLGYYPLAIAQAVNYLKNNSMITIEDYMRAYNSLHERRKTFLSYHAFEQDNYIKTSLTAFEISKNILVKELPEAYDLLKLCSHFSSDLIPASMFTNDIKNISKVLEILNKYSMLDIININGELFLNMHNVLKDSIKIQINEEKQEALVEEKVLHLLDKYFIYDFWNKENIEKTRLIIPHVDNFLNYLQKKNSILLRNNKLINILSKLGAFHIHCFRDTNEAVRVLEKAKHLAQLIGSAQKDLTNRIMEDLATSYYYQGEYNKARQEIQLVKKRNGASELSFLIEGHILYNECKYDEAYIAYNKVMKMLDKVKNLQYLALADRSLGLVFYRKSQFAASADKSKEYIHLSKKYLEKALEIQGKFNSENLELAITKHAYGRTAIKLKEFDKAERSLAEALRIAKDYCKKDEDHYEILVIKRSYGYYLCLHEKKRFEEGIKYLKEALEGKLRIYKNKPHQAIIGTMEPIIEVYAMNPKHKGLIKLMPMINQYLEDWALLEKLDQSKNINNQIIGGRIRSMKNTISKINAEYGGNIKPF